MTRLPWSLRAMAGAVLALLPGAARAQGLTPGQAATPPAVVGWLAQPAGTVWVAPGAGQAWQPALANQPLSGGEIVATAPDGQATIEVMAMRALLGPGSELALGGLGASGLSATAVSGEVALDLTNLPPGANAEIATPRGTVEIARPGRYEIDVGGAGRPTVVTALDGAASVVDGSAVENVGPGQSASFFGAPNGGLAVTVSPAHPDPLLAALIASSPPVPAVAPPPAVAEMTGGVNLASYGTWSVLPSYGTVWFPNVAVGWVPYRVGRWVFVPPWGWTWVDGDPWGFAPFHYGRWVQIGPRWGWVPVAPGIQASFGVPVYAPALVHFFAAGSIGGVGVSVGISAGALASGLVGWVPLGPREIYRPPYAVSPSYIREVNVYNVRNIEKIDVTRVLRNNVTINSLVNRDAVTTVPAAVLAEGRPVLPAYRRPAPATVAVLRPLPDGPPVRPGPHAVLGEVRGAPPPERFVEPHSPPRTALRVAPVPLPHPPSGPPRPAVARPPPHPAPPPRERPQRPPGQNQLQN